MQGEREWLPSRSNCKGPARATVCSHSSRTGSSCIATLREYRVPQAFKIGRSLYDQASHSSHLLPIGVASAFEKDRQGFATLRTGEWNGNSERSAGCGNPPFHCG